MDATLDKGEIGKSYEVVSFSDMPEATARRLESLGMTPQVVVDVLNNKSHGTVIVRMRESRWALGRTISSRIVVKPAEPADRRRKAPDPEFRTTAASCVIGAEGVDSVLRKPKTRTVGR